MTGLSYKDFYTEEYYATMVPGIPYERSANQ
jgi:hypothetical protein